jgi:phosphoserine phosphatase RsbU/P
LSISVKGILSRLRRQSLALPDGSGAVPPSAVVPLPLLRTFPGRVFLFTTGLLALIVAAQGLVEVPPALQLVRRIAAFGWLVGTAWIAILAFTQNRRAFLWRIRRKLLLSYVFLGVVPVVLVIAFVLAGGVLVYVAVASYVFREGFGDAVNDIRLSAQTMAIAIGRDPTRVQAVAEQRYSALGEIYPQLSIAVIDVKAANAGPPDRFPLASFGPWPHGAPPLSVPPWLLAKQGFTGTLVYADSAANGAPHLLIRSAGLTPDGTRFVVVDLPVDDLVIRKLEERTGTRIGRLSVQGCGATSSASGPAAIEQAWAFFQETVAFLDCRDWRDGVAGTVSINLVAPVGGIYDRIASVNATDGAPASRWEAFRRVLVILGVLFLIVQGSAFVMGAILAKSITSAVHELFAGTERVQQGDFAHRISIESRDQLGDLADSFNRMSSSIEHLLHVQREKQRLDDELRIAREIQKSLLPVHPPKIAGLDIADLCEPAREVGGDYYDFFDLGPNLLGVLIADVSGKGTSAALYMAELKGLMLALSHTSPSPRQLLIDVNRRLSQHLDNRSFVTMTYLTIDLATRTLVAARAGHTPLIVASRDRTDVIIPSGMVLGLRLPDALEKFEALLEEHTQPIAPGDAIVLYTDGITEAMDHAGEMFGDDALARVVTNERELSAAGIRERVLRDVKAFVGDAEPHDDMTMVVLKMTEEAVSLA